MMRFSELELKEKEGGGGPGRELADGQHGQGDWHCSQRSAHLGVTVPPAPAEKDGKEPLRAPQHSLSGTAHTHTRPAPHGYAWNMCPT